jgi:integrase
MVANNTLEEELIQMNPMGSVRLQRDKRSIEQRKWKKFTPQEIQRILLAMEDFWGNPVRNLSNDRRLGVRMAVRVLAFTAMRPREVLWLEPDDVTDRWIKVRNSKNKDSERCIPLHPEIADFPAFFHAGGFDTFKVQTKDRVQSVRHNFERLTREFMDPPILEEKKVLYSFRSTFSNAMGWEGASDEMRRAILGHTTAGALKHYDDGPLFLEKRKWVRATDPRKVYLDPDDPDDLDDDDLE